jgi:hypothetical protein
MQLKNHDIYHSNNLQSSFIYKEKKNKSDPTNTMQTLNDRNDATPNKKI